MKGNLSKSSESAIVVFMAKGHILQTYIIYCTGTAARAYSYRYIQTKEKQELRALSKCLSPSLPPFERALQPCSYYFITILTRKKNER